MPKYAMWDRVFSGVSWLIVGALISATVGVFMFPPTGLGPVAGALGIWGAQVIYGVLYGVLAVALAVAKLFRRKKFRKHVLMVTYLTGIMTTLLTVILVGFHPKIIDNVIIIVASAGAWVYWKFRIEYVNPKDFSEVQDYIDGVKGQ